MPRLSMTERPDTTKVTHSHPHLRPCGHVGRGGSVGEPLPDRGRFERGSLVPQLGKTGRADSDHQRLGRRVVDRVEARHRHVPRRRRWAATNPIARPAGSVSPVAVHASASASSDHVNPLRRRARGAGGSSFVDRHRPAGMACSRQRRRQVVLRPVPRRGVAVCPRSRLLRRHSRRAARRSPSSSAVSPRLFSMTASSRSSPCARTASSASRRNSPRVGTGLGRWRSRHGC